MYNYKLLNNEKNLLIVDNVPINKEDNLYTVIITNIRLLILDYPSKLYNSEEDLRSIGRINTVKMKEIVSEIYLDNIKTIEYHKDFSKYILNDNSYILINNKDIDKYMKNIIK